MAGKRTKVQLSIVSPTGYVSSTCGYCTAPGSGERTSAKTSKSYGIWAHRLSPYHYQSLIDQGWRRSGDYIYKPDLSRTCCAQIPIRLAVDEYKPTKGHRRALTNLLFRVRGSKPKPAKWKGRWSRGRDWNVEQRWQEIVTGSSSASAGPSSSSTWADEVAGPITQKLQVRLMLASCTDEKYQLFRRYQATVHGEPEDKINSEQGFCRFLVDTSMALTWPSSGEPLSTNQESQWRARSFDSADLPEELPYGCYHQEYRLDGKLVAVGVLDILPRCVSSVYVFYDPDWNDWQLGKVSALLEIALTKRLGRLEAMQHIRFYYMGFYIHTCQKMKYKAEYGPSQLLDCSDNTWRILADIRSSLDAKRFYSWSDEHQPSWSVCTSMEEQEAAGGSQDEDERRTRIPTQPRPPPGMLDAQAMVQSLGQMSRGSASSGDAAALSLLQEALVLEAQKQAQGIKPLLASDVFADFVRALPDADRERDSELVQAVECVAALTSPELVSQMVLFL